MFARSFLLIGAAAVLATVAGAEAWAGHGRHVHRKPVACYKRVKVPAVWKTVKYKVRAHRGHCTRRLHPAVWGTKKEQVVLRRERWKWYRTPAVYKTETFTRVVRPARVVRRWTRVRDAHPARGHHGRLHYRHHRKAVEVNLAPVVRTHTRRVLVSRSKHWREKVPAVLGWREYRVRLQHRRVERICQPPVEKWIERKVRVRRGHWRRVASRC